MREVIKSLEEEEDEKQEEEKEESQITDKETRNRLA